MPAEPMFATQYVRRWAAQHPLVKGLLSAIVSPFRSSVSANYKKLSTDRRQLTAAQLAGAWQSQFIPAMQRVGVDRTLANYRAGVAHAGFDALISLLHSIVDSVDAAGSSRSLLEIGCSSGYYAEALTMRNVAVTYSGCDYSRAFVEMARDYYPALDFRVEDATALSYSDSSYDIVVSGNCILHIADYPAAIRESARVARNYVIFHCTPILHTRATTYFTKRAYGVETVEIHFNEEELVALLVSSGLAVVGIVSLNAAWRDADAYVTKSYLCTKVTK